MSAEREDYKQAVHYQQMAADPRATRLASANAGSGKTRVLVSRVSRLLLDGADPDKILCLTYTKAAAGEMQTRLFQTLGDWSVMDEDALNRALDSLLGEQKKRDAETLGKARQLFARALETPDGLKVQTIHAFCERVLSRFPIEAGILPGFEPMDDMDGASLRASVQDSLYQQAWAEPDSALANAVAQLAASKADITLEAIFIWAAQNSEAVRQWKATGMADLALCLGVGENDTPTLLFDNAWNSKVRQAIKPMALSLMESSNANDQKKAQTILDALIAHDIEAGFAAYAEIFLTKKGDIRKGAVTKSAPPAAQTFFGVRNAEIPREAVRVYETLQLIKGAECLSMSRAVLTVASAFEQAYTRAKREGRFLDFTDQILLVRNLLTLTEAADWVRYKLDGGIAHILVDEAQDTSPEQWTIIDALKDGFALPDPEWPHDRPKTFFAVGDEKQSIYSFQGARPELFIGKIKDYVGDNINEALTMGMSFRSAPEVLHVVDSVFVDNGGINRMFNIDALGGGAFQIKHSAFRQDAGQVELWPLAPRPEQPEEEIPWDMTPVDSSLLSSARESLARGIAETIKQWLDEGKPVYDREEKHTRPMQPGDILILVRRRNAFFDGVIRNMKSMGIPVAGADRLVLKESMAVKDMLVLTQFALLPSDDLSLAQVLKSPLFGFSEDDLFACASRRGEMSLWESLQNQTFEGAAQAAETLAIIQKYARKYAPYEFYARVLAMTDAAGHSYLKRFHARLGIEAVDALEAFLEQALAHQRRGAPSLQHFLQAFSAGDQDIKREMDADGHEVRVMTVHGAKGLEAPVVFLPDTTQLPSSRGGPGIISVGSSYAYLPSKPDTPDSLSEARDAIKTREREEYMRLLYVAMTRAESRLIVCGFETGHRSGKGYSDGSWFDEVSNAMGGLETQVVHTPFGDGLMYGAAPKPPTATDDKTGPGKAGLPAWAFNQAKQEVESVTRVTPSHLLAPPPALDMPTRSPLDQSPDRFNRGNLIHKLLEILPDFEPQDREAHAQAFLKAHKDMEPAQKAEILDEVFRVLNDPEFAALFAPGSRAEVSLAGRGAGLPQGLFINAQIDRLAVTDDQVMIVDYKSNRPPPHDPEDVPDIYWGQMAAYRELVKEIYPGREIVCALLWTDGPFIMRLDEKRLDAALTLIGSVLT